MKKFLILIFLSGLNFGCELEESPSYALIENTLPEGGAALEYDPNENSLKNVDAVRAGLSGEDAQKFDSSLSWYGTESDFGLEKTSGKTARQLLDIVNCLKQASTRDQQEACFANPNPGKASFSKSLGG